MRNYLAASKADHTLKALDSQRRQIVVREATQLNDMHYDPSTKEIVIDSRSALVISDGKIQTPVLGFLHEAAHALQDLTNPKKMGNDRLIKNQEYFNEEERRVIQNIENPAAKSLGEPQRNNHGGDPVQVGCSTCTQ